MKRRQRFGYLVLAVVFGHVMVISAQISGYLGVTPVESITAGAFAEAQRFVVAGQGGIQGVWTRYVNLRALQLRSERLDRENAALRLELQRQRALAGQVRTLERLLGLRETLDLRTRAARVIGVDASPYFRTLTVDQGAGNGLRTDLAVISPGGVVGRVVNVLTERAARVQLLVDRNAAAGARIERTRAVGIVVGTGDDRILQLDYVSNFEDIRVDDRIVTSGTDGIYPQGLLVGHVAAVVEGADLYRRIDVESAVDVKQLEEVLIVLDRGAGTEAPQE